MRQVNFTRLEVLDKNINNPEKEDRVFKVLVYIINLENKKAIRR
jgi:hypothetical protein